MEDQFQRRKAGADCPMCPDNAEEDVVAILPSGRVHLKNDAAYRGYCVLVFHRHAVELYDLSVEERAQWTEDLARIGRAIEAVCQPAKLNLSMLGNLVPHFHCHLMPRYPTDPEWGQPPNFAPNAHSPLAPEDYQRLHDALSHAFRS
jgi:diadenosine tetraphosphate (Ap4A) HIT family hydrolase